jgi:hypothetical protein
MECGVSDIQPVELPTENTPVSVAVDRLWKLRAAFATGPQSAASLLKQVDLLDVAELDRILAARAARDFGHVTYQAAINYVARGDKGRDNLLLQELKIIRHISAPRLKTIRDRSLLQLRRLARNSITAPVTRSGDFERVWLVVMQYVRDTVEGRGARSAQWRITRSVYLIDGLIILLSNTPESVPAPTFHLSVSLAAGVLN